MPRTHLALFVAVPGGPSFTAQRPGRFRWIRRGQGRWAGLGSVYGSGCSCVRIFFTSQQARDTRRDDTDRRNDDADHRRDAGHRHDAVGRRAGQAHLGQTGRRHKRASSAGLLRARAARNPQRRPSRRRHRHTSFRPGGRGRRSRARPRPALGLPRRPRRARPTHTTCTTNSCAPPPKNSPKPMPATTGALTQTTAGAPARAATSASMQTAREALAQTATGVSA